jgi:hypothetical protein
MAQNKPTRLKDIAKKTGLTINTHYEQPSHDRQVFIDRVHFHQNKLSIEGPTIRFPKP